MPASAKLMVNLFDGARQPMADDTEALITLFDGTRQLFRDFKNGSSIPFDLDEPRDLRVLASVKNHRDSGFFPVKMKRSAWTNLDLMLLRRGGDFNFADSRWSKLPVDWRPFLAPKADYEETLENRPHAMATMMNVLAASDTLGLIPFIRSTEWNSIRNDRFYCWVEPEFVFKVSESSRFVPSPVGSHKGATRTFKQIDFNEANIQYSLHENTPAPPGLEGRVRVECDMDYYKDVGAHLLLEVLPHQLTGTRTNPAMVYMLRWMAARRAGDAEFAPPYVYV